MLKRAVALLEVRAVSDGTDERVFEGVATTPTPDRMGDVIEPKGARFKNPLPLLHQHDSDRPIGTVKLKRAGNEGITFEARIPKVDEPGPLKDRVDTAWGEIKAGLVRAVSIGFTILQNGMERLEDGSGWRFTAIEIVELSAVSVPANAEATITTVRALDRGQRAASGLPVVKATTPAASGHQHQPETRKGTAMPPTIAQQIENFSATRATKAARMAAIMEQAAERGETLDAEETSEYDDLDAEVRSIDSHLKRLHALEAAQAATATPVIRAAPGEVGRVTGDAGRIEPVVRQVERVDASIRVARLAKCIVLARMSGGLSNPLQLAAEQYPNDSILPEMVKAAVTAATTGDPNWAGALVGEAGTAFAQFLEYLRPQTIIGRFGTGGIPSLQAVPFRTPLGSQTSGGQGFWVGEGKAKPLTKFDFARTELTPLKVANIAVATKELIRDSSPSADGLIRNGLVSALRERLDIDFIDPAKAAVAGVSPASITNGVTPIPSTGTDADAVRQDVQAAFAAYKQGNNPLTGGVWIMPSSLALSLGMMTNLLGQSEFGGVTPTGGTFAGFPVIASDYVPDGLVVLVNAPLVYLADEGGFSVAMSDEASLEMSDAPTGDSGAPTGAQLVSMFQTNSVAILAERTINWTKARPNAAVVLEDVEWGTPAPAGP